MNHGSKTVVPEIAAVPPCNKPKHAHTVFHFTVRRLRTTKCHHQRFLSVEAGNSHRLTCLNGALALSTQFCSRQPTYTIIYPHLTCKNPSKRLDNWLFDSANVFLLWGWNTHYRFSTWHVEWHLATRRHHRLEKVWHAILPGFARICQYLPVSASHVFRSTSFHEFRQAMPLVVQRSCGAGQCCLKPSRLWDRTISELLLSIDVNWYYDVITCHLFLRTWPSCPTIPGTTWRVRLFKSLHMQLIGLGAHGNCRESWDVYRTNTYKYHGTTVKNVNKKNLTGRPLLFGRSPTLFDELLVPSPADLL